MKLVVDIKVIVFDLLGDTKDLIIEASSILR